MAFLKTIPSTATDEELVQAYQRSGDTHWVATLYQRYMELVYGVCLKYLQVAEDAQDSTMMIYEELCSKLPRHQVEHFKAWLYTLARNHCLMRLRAQKAKNWVPLEGEVVQWEENPHLDVGAQKEEQLQHMEQCLEQLPPAQKEAIELFYLQGKCYNEIAAATGLEWKQVRSYIQNGRRNLKICIDKQQKKEAYSS